MTERVLEAFLVSRILFFAADATVAAADVSHYFVDDGVP